MPSSLLATSSGGQPRRNLHRSDSNRSDRSDISAFSSEGGSSKKVSFNKAVRVKKYSTPPISPIDIPENKFWFKVYKTHQYKSDLSDSTATQFDAPEEELSDKVKAAKARPLSTIQESGDSISLSSTPEMNRKTYDKSYNNFQKDKYIHLNDNQFHLRCSANQNSPTSCSKSDQIVLYEPEIDYPQEPSSSSQKQSKKNSIVNGVKVIFGMNPTIPKKGKTPIKMERNQSVHENHSQIKSIENDSYKSSNLYSAPSRNANLTNYKSHEINRKSDISDLNVSNDPYKRYNEPANMPNAKNQIVKYNGRDDSDRHELALRSDSEEEYDPIKDMSIEVWESGPMLIADRTDFQKSLSEMPGEGRIYSSREEGSQLWKTKTRRRHVETVPKEKKEDHEERKRKSNRASSKSPTNLKSIEYKKDYHKKPDSITDDEKIVSAAELDDIFLNKNSRNNDVFSDSYVPLVRDVGIQCNRKKSSRHLTPTRDTSYRVIKSSNNGFVSAYSDVPTLKGNLIDQTNSKHLIPNGGRTHSRNDVIYSQIDKSKKRLNKSSSELSDRGTPQNEIVKYCNHNEFSSLPRDRRSLSPSRYQDSVYSTNTNRTIKNKTKGYGFNVSTGLHGPEINLPDSPRLKRYADVKRTEYYYDSPDTTRRSISNLDPKDYRKEVKEEIIEETISISNASSDDMTQQHTDIEEILAPKSIIREYDHKKKELSYENVSPNQRQMINRSAYHGATVHGGGLWYRDIDEDYRRGMAQSEVSYPAANEPTFLTLSRFESKSKKPENRDFSPPPRQAFTLDRKYLNEKKKQTAKQDNKLLFNGIGKDKQERFSSRSDANLTSPNQDYRGGLATAYKVRQDKRSSSLNRMNRLEDKFTYNNDLSARNANRLGSAGNSAHSSSDSDTHANKKNYFIHDRDPIVMYIPAISHHDRRADSDQLSGILRPSSIASSKRSNKSKKASKLTSASSDITAIKPRTSHNFGPSSSRNHEEELDQISELRDTKTLGRKKKESKTGLNRRHSIPKDTKFPWLQRLKLKVKSKDP